MNNTAAIFEDNAIHSAARLSPERALELAGVGTFEFCFFPQPCVVLSQRALKLLGLLEFPTAIRSYQEFIERFVIEADRSRTRGIFHQLLESGKKIAFKYRVMGYDDGVRDVRGYAVRECDGAGNYYITGTLQDATIERRKEEDLRRMQHKLTQVSRSSLLGEMSSGIAHEINQPLAAIATFANAGVRLLQRPGPPITSVIEILRDVSSEALRAGDMIRRMRALMTSHALPAPIDLREILAELRSHYDAIAHPELNLQIAELPYLRPVLAERSQIHHVIVSLLQNAIEAGREAHIAPTTVRIQVAQTQHDVEVAVEDNGPGVSPEAVAHLFMPFYTTKAHSAGLGLASSRSIVEAHRGRIEYSRAPIGGARFAFRLPIASRFDE